MVTLAFRRGRRWDQLAVPVADIGQVTKMVAGQSDVYISQNRFFGRRRITHLAQLDACFVDLDFYNVPSLAHMHPMGVLELAYEALEDAKVPQPSFSVVNGQGGGAYLVWLHDPVPRQALPRWNACQRVLWETLKHLGADRRALDAARVLRLVGTLHTGTGAIVQATGPARPAWPFDSLADEILPYTRAELHDIRVQRALKRGKEPQVPTVRPPQGFNQATLWEARLSDLQRLLDLRFWRPLPPGHRDEWLFQASVAMSWLAPPLVLQREVYALAHQVGGWDEGEARSRLSAVVNRCYAAARGETVYWQGQERDPRYWLKNETMIERLGITLGRMKDHT